MNNFVQGLAVPSPVDYNRYNYQTGSAGSVNQYNPGLGNALAPAKKAPQILEQQGELAERLYLQEKLLSVLMEKLQPVMSLHPPQEAMGQEEKADLGPTCPVANSLYRLAILVSSSNRILQSLIDRVEV